MINLRIQGIDIPVLESETGVRLNKKAFDIENIDRRFGDWSKSIQVASSPIADDLFNYYFNVNASIKNATADNFNPDFNPNLKADCSIYVDGIPVLEGHAQLLRITIDNENKIVYHINCFSTVKGFFEIIEDRYLQDLDVSDLNHVYTTTNTTGTWSYTNVDDGGYVYPMIDYGKQDQQTWKDTDFKPAIFTKEIVDRIFIEAGYEYSSEFFNGSLFKKLIHPAEYNVQLSDATINGRQFYVSRQGTNQTVDFVSSLTSSWAAVTQQLVFNTDTGNNYNTTGNKYSTTNGIFTPNTWNGRYKFKGKIKAKVKYTSGTSYSHTALPIYLDCKVAVVLYDNVNTQGLVVGGIELNRFEYTAGTLTTNEESSSVTVYFETPTVRMNDFHSLYLVAFTPQVYSEDSNGRFTIGLRPDNFDFILETTSEFGGLYVETETQIGDTIEMQNVLPEEVKQKDYMVSLIEMFNLYVVPDPTNSKKLIIEPRDTFFTDVKENITELLDTSQPFEIEPMALLRAKRYEWSYREDNDVFNKTYQYMWQEDYGMYRKDIVNDFLFDTKKISVIFAPTPLVNYPKNNNSSGNDRIISAIIFEDAKDGKGTSKQRIRILYWGGMLDTNTGWRYFSATPSPLLQIYTQYPYAGHLDDPYDPFIDLCFGTPRAVFYDNVIGGYDKLTYLDANLYNVYWKRWINEITDKESKVITCNLRLTPLDYFQLSFRKLYFIGDATYRLLEVVDYDIQGNETAKCRFLKTNPFSQHAVNRGTFNGGRDTIGGGSDIAPGFMRTLTNNNLDRYADSFVLSDSDDRPYLRGFVYGFENKGGNVAATLINANNNEIRGNNVVLLNTSDRIVSGDEVWANDIFVEKYAEILLQNSDIIESYNSDVFLLPSLPSNQYYKINRVLSSYDYNGTQYNGGGEFLIYTDTSFNTLASNNGAISGTADKKSLWTIAAEISDWGEGVVIRNNNANDNQAGGTLTLKIYYQIIELL